VITICEEGTVGHKRLNLVLSAGSDKWRIDELRRRPLGQR
jgi:hypothetical protein